MNGSPVVNPASQNEQSESLPGPRPATAGAPAPLPTIKSPLDLSSANDIIKSSGLGAQQNLNQQQFKPEMPGEPEEGAEAAGAGELADLAPLAALA